jgi:hypothetical protein
MKVGGTLGVIYPSLGTLVANALTLAQRCSHGCQGARGRGGACGHDEGDWESAFILLPPESRNYMLTYNLITVVD